MARADRRSVLKAAAASAAVWAAAPIAAAAFAAERRLAVGVIGRTGRGDYGHGIDTVWREIDRTEVVALADPDETGRVQGIQRTGARKGYADYREMLDKERLDIVAVCPRWLDQHRDMCVAAAEHGCHIYMEKPFCRDLSEADDIVQACEKHGVKLAIAHQTRWSPPVEVVQGELQKGIIGRVLEIRMRGKEDARGGGEDLWVLGSHVLNLMRFFIDDPLDCRATVLNGGRPATKSDVLEGKEGIRRLTGDAINAWYNLPDGITGYFASHRNRGGDPWRYGLQIFGTEGVIDVLTGHPAKCYVLQDSSWSPGRSGKQWVPISSHGVGRPETLPAGTQHVNVLAVNDLVDCIGSAERQPRCNMYDARWTVEMIAGVFESHRRGGCRVELPLQNRIDPLTLI